MATTPHVVEYSPRTYFVQAEFRRIKVVPEVRALKIPA